MTLNIAVIPGDGIGKEIVPEGLKVLDRVLADRGVDYSTTHFDLGAERWHATGDTLTDEAGAVTGGIGLSASGNLNPSREYPSMFEPVHGSAPDIAGQGKADPTATISSVALMLDFMGYADEASRVRAAIDADMAARAQAAANGNPLVRSTSQIGDDIAARL